MKYLRFLSAVLLSSTVLFSQAAQSNTAQATTGVPAPQLHGNGVPTLSQWVCGANIPNVSYIQDDATNGRLWMCATPDSGATWAWVHFLNPIGTAVTAPLGGAALVALPVVAGVIGTPGCATTTVTIAGIAPGINGAIAIPLSVQGAVDRLVQTTADVTSLNTVTVNRCNYTAYSTTPAAIKYLVVAFGAPGS